ncbi:MAG TPA: wax ester/triacylglycerol synthase family O-acyltransferase, partial [Thermoleophilaceae bacterium]|nr:wax ester/triacylglycerol synthase family O-acyltransferase [Thermoleophilaceae bacterium]
MAHQAHKDRLTAVDAAFLHQEKQASHMHVGALVIFDGPAPEREDLAAHIEARLRLVPRYRQKLAFPRLEMGRPFWVDDPSFNLDYHVRHTALPKPGSDAQLRQLVGRIFSQRLDRSKPLWELWLVEGLDDGRFAIIGKSHHALVDGISGVDITTVLFDLDREPEGPSSPPPPWVARPEPTDFRLLQEALRERLTSPSEIVRGVRHALRGPRKVLHGVGATTKMVGAGLAAPDSVFNVEIGPHRRFTWAEAEVDELKRIKNEHGGTLNDVILSVVAGALGKYMRARGHGTEELELRALVPVSVRAEEQHGALGNQVAGMMAPLPIWCEEPVERLKLVSAAMGDLKSSGQAVGAQILTQLADFAPPTI